MQNINKIYARNLAMPIDIINKKKQELPDLKKQSRQVNFKNEYYN